MKAKPNIFIRAMCEQCLFPNETLLYGQTPLTEILLVLIQSDY